MATFGKDIPNQSTMSFPNKSFNKVLPGEPVCICIKGVYSWYTEAQIKKFLDENITHHIVKITDIYIKPGNFTNDVYVCFSDFIFRGGVSSHYGYDRITTYYGNELECMTETFAYGASYAISAPESECDDLEWTCYYVDSILSYSDIMKNAAEPTVVDSYVNVIVGVETDDLYDNDTVSTHSSMPELIDAADADAEDEDMDVDEKDKEEEEEDEEEEDEDEENEDDDEENEDDDNEDNDDEDDDEEDEDDDNEDNDNDDTEKCNIQHNISQVLDWVVLKFDLNDTKTVIHLLIALNYLNILVNCALLMFILQSL